MNSKKGKTTMFDIYLYRGYKTDPNPEDIFKVIQVVNKGDFLLILKKENPGFLGLNLSWTVAKEVLTKLINLESRRVNGRVYPVRYRDEKPRFTVETAYPIAEKAIMEMQLKYPDITFSPIKYSAAYSRIGHFTFISTGREWVIEGKFLYANVDILDGHIWAGDEMEKWPLDE